MIYTIGHKESYELYFDEQGTPQKLGQTENYVGGSVWKTLTEARNFCPDDYDVYGVNADWDTQTTPSADGKWNDLLVTSELIRL